MTKKSTHWVTIPEEKIHTPVSKTSKKEDKMTAKDKFFWGAGFVAVIIIAATLLAPQQMANILQGNLFEQTGFQPLQVIPVEDEVVEPELVPESEPVPQYSDVIAVEAETEAVTIQIDPVDAPTAEPIEISTEEPAEAPSDIKTELDANRQLLEELSKQIAEFKERDDVKTGIIEELTDMMKDQTAQEMHPSAPETPSPAVSTTTTIGQTSAYRINPHTVAISPHQVLQQNTTRLQAQQQYIAADLTAQDYASHLAQVQGTPDSGPKEVLLFSLVISFLALLGWKIGKLGKV